MREITPSGVLTPQADAYVLHQSKIRLLYLSNLSVRNFGIFLFMHAGSVSLLPQFVSSIVYLHWLELDPWPSSVVTCRKIAITPFGTPTVLVPTGERDHAWRLMPAFLMNPIGALTGYRQSEPFIAWAAYHASPFSRVASKPLPISTWNLGDLFGHQFNFYITWETFLVWMLLRDKQLATLNQYSFTLFELPVTSQVKQ